MEKWQIPFRLKCKRLYSMLGEDLLVILGLGFIPNVFPSIVVTEKATRTITPKCQEPKIFPNFLQFIILYFKTLIC